MTLSTSTVTQLVDAYYASWTHGIDAFDLERLRSILAKDLDFQGPVAGHRMGAEGFIRGVADVARALRSFTLLQRVEQGDQVAVLYECELTRPAGTHRFAEFFYVEDGRIRALKLLYDATNWR